MSGVEDPDLARGWPHAAATVVFLFVQAAVRRYTPLDWEGYLLALGCALPIYLVLRRRYPQK